VGKGLASNESRDGIKSEANRKGVHPRGTAAAICNARGTGNKYELVIGGDQRMNDYQDSYREKVVEREGGSFALFLGYGRRRGWRMLSPLFYEVNLTARVRTDGGRVAGVRCG